MKLATLQDTTCAQQRSWVHMGIYSLLLAQLGRHHMCRIDVACTGMERLLQEAPVHKVSWGCDSFPLLLKEWICSPSHYIKNGKCNKAYLVASDGANPLPTLSSTLSQPHTEDSPVGPSPT